MTVRKNQNALSIAEWKLFIDAFNKATKLDIFSNFVTVYQNSMTTTGSSWGAHTTSPHVIKAAPNFLPWHRYFIWSYENHIKNSNAGLTLSIPYWDFAVDRSFPTQLTDPALLANWGIKRQPLDSTKLPTSADIAAVLASSTFAQFQSKIINIHAQIGLSGSTASMYSLRDPLFFLHHAFLDKLFDQWLKGTTSVGSYPSNLEEVLSPSPLFGVTVQQVLNITTLGYQYV